MPLLLLALGIAVYLFLWHQWRSTTLTRDCAGAWIEAWRRTIGDAWPAGR